MPILAVAGLNYATDRYTIDSTGEAITTGYPVKTFLIKCAGGQCYFKRSSTVADGDAYILDDGESVYFDLKLDYSTANGGVSLCFLKAVSGDVTINIILGY